MTTTVTVLPEELLLKVFTYLDQKHLGRVALVCTKWHQVSKDHSLWKSLLLYQSSRKQLKSYVKLVERCPQLSRLNIFAVEIESFCDFWKSVPKLISLRELSLTCVYTLVCYDIEQVLFKCPFIETFNLKGCKGADFKIISKIVTLPNLHTIFLRGDSMSDACVITLAKNCQKLKRLYIVESVCLSDKAVSELSKYRRDSLEELCLGTLVEDGDMTAIGDCKNLTRLELVIGRFPEQTLKAIGSLPNLKVLNLYCAYKGVEMKDALEKFFRSCSTLKELQLTKVPLDDGSIEVITDVSWKGLHKLSIVSSSITDQGMVKIILNCKHLNLLSLREMEKITGEFLFDIPRHGVLRRLMFFRCPKVEDEFCEDLARAMPSLKIVKPGLCLGRGSVNDVGLCNPRTELE